MSENLLFTKQVFQKIIQPVGPLKKSTLSDINYTRIVNNIPPNSKEAKR